MSHRHGTVGYYLAKARALRARRIDPTLTDHPATLAALRRDGVVIVEDFLTGEQIDTIVDEIHARTDLLSTRSGPRVIERNARYLLIDPTDLVPSSRVFFDHIVIRSLARAYLSHNAIPDRPAIQLKCNPGQASIVDFYHIDEWRHLVSAFLLLDDVGPTQAPMVYLKGSHRWRPWRLRKEQEFYRYYDRGDDGRYHNEESAYCGCVLPTDARRLRERHGYQQLECTGRKGALILFDNLGLHRASPLQAGQRLILSSYWMLPK